MNENFGEFYLTESHPSPSIKKKLDEIVICCKDDYEAFFPSTTKEEIILDHQAAKFALLKLLNELDAFSVKLNSLSGKYKFENISNIMIWGSDEKKYIA